VKIVVRAIGVVAERVEDIFEGLMSVGLQGSCILILDPNRFNLTVRGRQRLFSWTRTML
jgi:hypothetical protein